MNNILTASRQAALLSCPRSHYWAYEVGLRRTETGKALRIGSAWHRAMEALCKNADYSEALECALAPEIMPEMEAATIAGLLAAYVEHYKEKRTGVRMLPEKEFNLPIVGSKSFRAAGKIDSLGTMEDELGINTLMEHKTTGTSVEPDSDYWLRLRFNTQVFQYVLAARALGVEVHTVLYDVTRKPSIKPKMINDLDDAGLKIVLDASGTRVFLKNGQPRQSGGEFLTVKEHRESASEYSDRLYKDCLSRPDFYFARREVPILADALVEFQHQRLALARLIEHCRDGQRRMPRPEMAWPRNVGERTCKFCQYQSFCLQNVSPDLRSPPPGFAVGKFNPELSIVEEESETE